MERREYSRIPVPIHAEVEIYPDAHDCEYQTKKLSSIKGMVNTIDISLGGFCVKVIQSFKDTGKSFSPAIAYLLVGKTITAYFKDYSMTISGEVVRVDPETMLMAVVITRVSDISCWRQLCGKAIYEQSDR